MSETPRVGIVMGSDSDWPVMEEAAKALAEFDVAYEADVVSAHRMPEQMLAYGKEAAGRGLEVIIAGAGGAAHLPGMLASVTPLPVVGVPVPLKHLDGMDSLLSIVQMPAGVPVATVGVGNARNAGLLAVRILAVSDAGAARADGRVPGRAQGDRGDQGRVGPQRVVGGTQARLLRDPWRRSDRARRGRRRPLPRAAGDGRHPRARRARPRRQPDDSPVAGRRPRLGAVRGARRREPGADDRAAHAGPRPGAGTAQPWPWPTRPR